VLPDTPTASVPLVASLRFLAYIDNRTRREGWDIQVRFSELARVLREDLREDLG